MTEARVRLGRIVLFGSGETSASGRVIHDRVMSELLPPVVVAILETPAGFQPNSEHVAREVGEFIEARLRNYQPQVCIIPARKKGTPFSPDDPRLLEPLLNANYIFLGPGSPTYAAHNLKGTLALECLMERHKAGAVLCFASAATLAVGTKVLPVYEIFKAGADLYWEDGLGIFAFVRPGTCHRAALEQYRRRCPPGHQPVLHGTATHGAAQAALARLYGGPGNRRAHRAYLRFSAGPGAGPRQGGYHYRLQDEGKSVFGG